MVAELRRPPSAPPQTAGSGLAPAGQSLCIACGLCCDGTLFEHVNLAPDDDIATIASFSVQIISDAAPPAFKQPCTAYKSCLCSIYSDRPHACRNFQCSLLKRVEASGISQADALEIIRATIMVRDEVKANMRAVFGDAACNFDKFTERLKSSRQHAASPEAKDRISKLFEKFAVLWLCINKHFLDQWQR